MILFCAFLFLSKTCSLWGTQGCILVMKEHSHPQVQSHNPCRGKPLIKTETNEDFAIKKFRLDPRTIHTNHYSAPTFINFLGFTGICGRAHSVKHCPLLEPPDIFLALKIESVKAFPVITNVIIFCEQFQSDTGKPMLCRDYHDLQNSCIPLFFTNRSLKQYETWSFWINNLCQLSRTLKDCNIME